LFTTSETENVGISGELRFLNRVCDTGSSREEPRADEGPFFERERARGLGLRAGACVGTGTGGGDELPIIEENEECDE